MTYLRLSLNPMLSTPIYDSRLFPSCVVGWHSLMFFLLPRDWCGAMPSCGDRQFSVSMDGFLLCVIELFNPLMEISLKSCFPYRSLPQNVLVTTSSVYSYKAFLGDRENFVALSLVSALLLSISWIRIKYLTACNIDVRIAVLSAKQTFVVAIFFDTTRVFSVAETEFFIKMRKDHITVFLCVSLVSPTPST